MVAAITPKWEDCGQCDGYGYGPDVEEGSGIPYTCYACSATGRVPFGTHDAERLEQARHAGYATVAEFDAAWDATNARLNRLNREREQWENARREQAEYRARRNHPDNDGIPW